MCTFTSKMFVVVGEVTPRCNTSKSMLLTWESNEVEDLNGAFTMSQTLAVATHNLTVKPKRLPVGLYFIRLIAEMTKEEGAIGYDYGFLQVVTWSCRGVNKVVKGTGNIVLDATDSYDPHDPDAKDQGMVFTRLCRRGRRFLELTFTSDRHSARKGEGSWRVLWIWCRKDEHNGAYSRDWNKQDGLQEHVCV